MEKNEGMEGQFCTQTLSSLHELITLVTAGGNKRNRYGITHLYIYREHYESLCNDKKNQTFI